ncbi:MAG TPA: 3H domain-containing protein, partial [Pseudogracilibacillus sp.]|nr:3H domain-containing protein [Pseudogracilibacillus sp.]
FDAKEFAEKILQAEASLLSELTDGVHIHTLIADSNQKIEAAYEALKEANILIEK